MKGRARSSSKLPNHRLKALIVARREFVTNIKRKEFLFVTFFLPFIVLAMMGIPL